MRADFIDKATGKPAGSHDGALLIAADGIHSAVREKLYPQEGPPIWNGRILWRGITASDAFLSGRTMIMAGHEILKFVCYPISKEADAIRQISDQLGRRAAHAADLPVAPRGLQPHGKARRIPAVVRGLEVRLARRARPDPQLPACLTNIRWSTAIRSRNGPSAASP